MRLPEFSDEIRTMLKGLKTAGHDGSIPVCAFLFDPHGNFVECSQSCLDFFHFSTKEDFFRSFASGFPAFQPDGERSFDTFDQYIKKALSDNISFDWVFTRSDGKMLQTHVRFICANVQKDKGQNCTICYVYELYKDDKKPDEEEAHETHNEHLQLFVDNMPLGCSLRNSSSELLDCNPAALKIFGLTDKNDYTARWPDLMPEYQPDGSKSVDVLAKLTKTTLETGYVQHEWMLQKIDGTPIWAESTFYRVKWRGEANFVYFIRDLTEIYKYKKEQKELLEKAQAASRAKSDFLSNMSHEIRTPMNAIIGMTMIGKSATDIHSKDYAFERIERASNHLLGVLNDVLEMSKIEAGKFELHCQPFEFRKAINNIKSILKSVMEANEQQFTIELDESIPQFIIGDEMRLTQVITNLLTNSVKFTSNGGSITLRANSFCEDGFDNIIRFEIIDTGIGIPKEQQTRLFNAFEQAESNTTRRFGGTGLGLAISKRIVEAMGGEISVESEQGKGATFIFTIQYEVSDVKPHCEATTENEQINSFKGKRLLLVEDMDINREIVMALLEPTEVEIECATNGVEAINIFLDAPESYDMILMDIQMPIMDGLSATQHIRESNNEWAKQIPIIAMTANVFREDIEQCLQAGMNDHLGKPLEPRLMIEKLRTYLKP